LAFSLLGEDQAAEDVVQETFLSALDHRASFEGRSSLSTWLYRIAYNAAQNRLRRKPEEALPGEDEEDEQGRPLPMPKSLGEWEMLPERILIDAEARSLLDAAVSRLATKLRVVFQLRDIDELSTEETAQVLGVTEPVVKVRLHRARLQLREELATYFSPFAAGGAR
jgi:RNA polymerase sigma-70 factor (ECF subfamily)